MSAVVDEGEKILSPTQGTCIDLSTQVTVDKIQWLFGSTAPTGRKCALLVFSLDARLTDLNILGVVEVKALHHVVSGELLQLRSLRCPNR